ncbi:MAG: hypothetical protein PHS00_00695 [Candidatus Pacebacteria bacterium]|nr:hypothetical protein [Candidatus Paceibacterota bacterium]
MFSEKETNQDLKFSAIDNFKFGVKRINNGEDPKVVGEIALAIEELKDYQEKEDLSNEKMFELLENNGLSIFNLEVKQAIEKSFVADFEKTLDVCRFYRDVMELDLSTDILESIKDSFINQLSFRDDYREMIEVGGFSEEFLNSERVKEATKERLKDIIKRGSIDEILNFMTVFKIEDLSFFKEDAENSFIKLAEQGDFKKALEIKKIFKLENCKKLLPKLKDFYNKL